MANAAKISIEFFHDAMSCWCYPVSPRLRNLVREHPEVEVVQRSFAIFRSRELMLKVFPSREAAKKEICMVHWWQARELEKDDRIQCEKMMAQPFDYPYSMPNLLGGKAAELQGGQAAHWDYFDRVQHAHLTECRNIAETDVLRDCARDIGLDVDRWQKDFESPQAQQAVDADLARLKQYGIGRTPALVANGRYQCLGYPKSIYGATISTEHLEIFYNDVRRELVAL
ncbi:MAG: DsbA family protein [Candidatus Binatia bacterium]